MAKSKAKKVIIISVIAVGVLTGVGFGAFKYTKVIGYDNLIKNANKYMDQGEYAKAIDLYQQSLNYKDDPSIENSIKLAQSLMEVKKIYDEGTRLMKDRKYLEAMDKFKMIRKDNETYYANAQDKLKECAKDYADLNIGLAKNAIDANSFDEADKYIAEVLKVDNSNEEAKKLKESITKKIQDQDAAQKAKDEQDKVAKATSTTTASKLTSTGAEDIVKKLMIKNSNSNMRAQFDHEETVNGTKYFVVHVYEVVSDHTATLGWYYVNQSNGKVFDGTLGDLKPMN